MKAYMSFLRFLKECVAWNPSLSLFRSPVETVQDKGHFCLN